tara:strand:+ start:151 stop:393 length:243 start_codon:yes stop_codon:yes gene_type:complete
MDLFADPGISRIILDAFVHLQVKMQVKIYGFVIMHTHIHFIVESNNLSEKIRRFKSFNLVRLIVLFGAGAPRTSPKQELG